MKYEQPIGDDASRVDAEAEACRGEAKRDVFWRAYDFFGEYECDSLFSVVGESGIRGWSNVVACTTKYQTFISV